MKAYRDETTGRWHSDLPDVFDLICQKLRDREPFSFARYGDGEFNAIYGKKGANCDGHEYFPDLGKRLREALESNPDYIVGLQPLTLASDRWPQIQKDFPNVNWVDADSIHNASIDGRLNDLISILYGRAVIVGPKHLQALVKGNGFGIIEIPSRNCWESYIEVAESIRDVMFSARPYNCVFLLCASMMSEVLVDESKDSGYTFIDMGSALDPYCGVKSRRYHHKLNINAGLSPS